MCCDETAEYSVCDGWPNGDVGGRKLRRLARSSRRGTLELGTEDTDEQSRQACTVAAVESSASADHHATAAKDHARVSGFCSRDQTRYSVLYGRDVKGDRSTIKYN